MVASPNGSAESDDGMVSFVRTPAGEVEVQVFARQRFRLPTAVAVMGVERFPAVHAPLVADAYARFFDGTIDNMRAVFEGRPYRVGHVPGMAAGPSDLQALLSGALAVIARVFGWAPAATTAPDGGGRVEPWLVDERGFAHFAGQASPALTAVGNGHGGGAHDPLTPMAFLAELGQAVGRDLAALGLPMAPATPQ